MTGQEAFSNVKALLFDVFGTTVDWRTTVTNDLHREAQAAITKNSSSISPAVLSKAKGMNEEAWGDFAQQWRTSYYLFTKSILENPDQPYKTVDEHHHDELIKMLEEWQLSDLWTAEDVQRISLIWHKLDPWPDTVQGLKAFNTRFPTCTLSNGSVLLLTNMAKHANLPWTHFFSSNMFGSYKPSPKVYLGAAERLNLKPEECALVAAHLGDLDAARGCGYKTVFIERPQEETWSKEQQQKAKEEGWVDLWIEDGNDGFLTAARKLGCDVA